MIFYLDEQDFYTIEVSVGLCKDKQDQTLGLSLLTQGQTFPEPLRNPSLCSVPRVCAVRRTDTPTRCRRANSCRYLRLLYSLRENLQYQRVITNHTVLGKRAKQAQGCESLRVWPQQPLNACNDFNETFHVCFSAQNFGRIRQ